MEEGLGLLSLREGRGEPYLFLGDRMAKTKTAGRIENKILEDGTIMIFGVIGDEWDDLDSETIVSAIAEMDDPEEIRVLINSPGGDVFEGLAIYHELATNPANVRVEITGVAASMASAVAMAGDEIAIAQNGHVMIHDPWNVAVGNAEELREAAELLDRFGTSLAEIYSERTGLDEEEIRDMMAEETWLNAEEALEKGFVDEIMRPSEAEAFADLDISELAAAPAALTRLIKEGRKMAKTRKNPTQGGEPAGDPNDPGNEPAGEPAGNEPDPSAAAGDGPTGGGTPSEPADPDAVREAARAAVREERERTQRIRALTRRHDLGEEFEDEMIASELSMEEVNARVLDRLAERQEENGPGLAPGPTIVRPGEAGRDRFLNHAVDSIIARSSQSGRVESHEDRRLEPGDFRGYSLMDLARESLHRSGVRTAGMGRKAIAGAALGVTRPQGSGYIPTQTRSDFPILLENALHKMLQAAYATAPDTWRRFCAVGSVSDFRDHKRLRLGSLSALEDKNEAGEFRHKQISDAESESIAASTKGNVIGLTREAIVNDDVDGFSRLIAMLGRAAARSVEIDVYALFAENAGQGPTLGTSGAALFDESAHGNVSGTTGGPATAVFEAARVLMAQQQDQDGNDYLDLRPSIWVGPIGIGGDARSVNDAQYFVTGTDSDPLPSKPNIVRGLFDDIVDTPRLSGNTHYIFADPDVAPVFEVVFLDGMQEPMLETEEGFDYDGVRWKVVYDYGVGAIDFRGAVQIPGS